jgi:hypothetical protein
MQCQHLECLTLKYPMCSCAFVRLAISLAARVARFRSSTIVGGHWPSIAEVSAISHMKMVAACAIMKAKNTIGSAIADTTGAFMVSESSVLVSMPSSHSWRTQKSNDAPNVRSTLDIWLWDNNLPQTVTTMADSASGDKKLGSPAAIASGRKHPGIGWPL